jgi:XTP/dITP diphosphohydrolase
VQTKKKTILIATSNKGKYNEYLKLLEPIKHRYELMSLKEANIKEFPEESGLTYEDNALIKSQYYCKLSGMTTIADDSGLSISALSGLPGIHSARWSGADKSFKEAFDKIFDALEQRGMNPDTHKVSAELNCTISYSEPNNIEDIAFFTGILKGTITKSYTIGSGFGYDPIFIPDNKTKKLSELSMDEKNKISHRFIATNKLISCI